MLGGEISITSSPGKGSTFSLTVETGPLESMTMLDCPAPLTTQTHHEPPRPNPPVQLDCRILLAEDGPDNQRLISFLLSKAGAEVTVVENGQIAMDCALQANDMNLPFDVLLMDMQMPIMDGYEATRRLRHAGYAAPIIALTAHAMAGDHEKCVDAGCDDYITKPLDRNRLLSLVAEHADKHRETTEVVDSEPADSHV